MARVEIGGRGQGQDVWARWIDGRVQGDRGPLRVAGLDPGTASRIRTRSRRLSRDSWTRERPPLSLMPHRIDLTLARGLHEAAGRPMVLR